MMKKVFDDIWLTSEFISDYDNLPKHIKKKIDRRVYHWSLIGHLPPSAQAHKVWGKDDPRWIAYLSCSKGSYRLLLEIKDRNLWLMRVQDHEGNDKLLKVG